LPYYEEAKTATEEVDRSKAFTQQTNKLADANEFKKF
jgi:hypothetical protein